MIADLLDILFGCWHSNYSFPLTPRPGHRIPAAQFTGTYVCCLDCGKEAPYCWKTMRVLPLTNDDILGVAPVPVASKQRL